MNVQTDWPVAEEMKQRPLINQTIKCKGYKMELKENGVYRHYKGGEYKLMTIGELEHDLSQVVVYESITNDRIFVRPLKEFEDKFEFLYMGG